MRPIVDIEVTAIDVPEIGILSSPIIVVPLVVSMIWS